MNIISKAIVDTRPPVQKNDSSHHLWSDQTLQWSSRVFKIGQFWDRFNYWNQLLLFWHINIQNFTWTESVVNFCKECNEEHIRYHDWKALVSDIQDLTTGAASRLLTNVLMLNIDINPYPVNKIRFLTFWNVSMYNVILRYM